ncbi:MAG: hypothetical protein U5L96_17775 [Owenweeksia sp.]|nr:hypothetical protein [Owenweeksia sp.]
MSKDKKNIEDFLRDKLDGLEHGYRNDWAQFEEKLERALFFYRLKIGAMISAILILVSLGIFGTSAFIESERREQATSEEAIQNWNIPESIQKQPARVGTTDEPGRRASQTGVQFWPELSSIILENQASSQKFKDAFGAPTSYNKASSERTMASRVEQGPNELVSKLLENGNRMSSRTAESSSKINQGPISMVPEPGQLSGERRTPEQEYRAASNKKLKPEADARPNQSNVELKLPLIPPKLSLNMDMTGLKAQLAKGELGELRVKPPIMPVNLERVGPYISPMQHKSRWSYALSVYPNFTFRKFKVDKDKLNRIHRDFIDATQSSERVDLALTLAQEPAVELVLLPM